MNKLNLLIELDDSVKENPLFSAITSISISKMDIFKYGSLNLDVPPSKIGEYEFDYLEGTIPHLFAIYNDWISFGDHQLVNLGHGETATKVSEIIGVGVGLFYSISLLSLEPNKIKKIPPADKKQKYLDFAFIKNKQQYEFEAKGTTYESQIKSKIDDIKLKKKDKPQTACRFGAVTLARKPGEAGPSKSVICDAYEKILSEELYNIYDYLEYYLFVFSLILDNPQYNKLNKKINARKFQRNSIKSSKIQGRYIVKGIKYFGRYFDKRLMLEKIRENLFQGITLHKLFANLTNNVGKEKYFLGIDERVIVALNNIDINYLDKGTSIKEVKETKERALIIDNDGVIFARSVGGADSQVEENFTEIKVKERLKMLFDYSNNERHSCGAPCRSREIEGKPCEIMTYREHCHFHR